MPTSHEDHALAELAIIASAIGKMFPGLCEVVVHDLRNPDHAIHAIENNLSGRHVGDPATELGHLRINDPDFPNIVQNYPNSFPNGRTAKSTSIGIKNKDGQYFAALCLNLDTTLLAPVTQLLTSLTATNRDAPAVAETLQPQNSTTLRAAIESFAAQRSTIPRLLPKDDKKQLVTTLNQQGFFELRDAASTIAQVLGVSRATVYNYTK